MKFTVECVTDFYKRTKIEGRVVPDSSITMADVEKVIEIEQFLEKITGRRWHISSET